MFDDENKKLTINAIRRNSGDVTAFAAAVQRVIWDSPTLTHVRIDGRTTIVVAVLPMLPAIAGLRDLCIFVSHPMWRVDIVTVRHLEALTGLRALNISFDNRFRVKDGSDVSAVEALGRSLRALTGLQELRIRDAPRDRIAVVIAPSLIALTALRVLNLCGNSIRADGAAPLAASLTALTALQELDLSDNGIQKEGIAPIAASLTALTALQELDLGDNLIQAVGAAALAASLPALTALRKLDLGGTYIGAQGVAALVPSLLALTALRELRLGGDVALSAPLASLSGLTNLTVVFA